MGGKNGGIFCLLLKNIFYSLNFHVYSRLLSEFSRSIQFNLNPKDSRSSKTMQHTNQSKKRSGASCLIKDIYTVIVCSIL